MPKVKICGLSRHEDIEYVSEFKPDYIGFVFSESKRKVQPDKALRLRQKLAAGIVPVGVFVNEPITFILSVVNYGVIDIIQLHGEESESYIAELKTAVDKPIITVYRKSALADYLLFDGPVPGSGNAFDWDKLPQTEKPFFLAGGLNPDNAAAAIAKVNPFAVDVSSGVEVDGVKDRGKIRAFIQNVRRAVLQ